MYIIINIVLNQARLLDLILVRGFFTKKEQKGTSSRKTYLYEQYFCTGRVRV